MNAHEEHPTDAMASRVPGPDEEGPDAMASRAPGPDVAQPTAPDNEAHRLADTVREACLRAALDGYERAGFSGLCAEGRWEMAIDAIRSLDLDAVVGGSQPL
jgi:hypothetical protein